MPIDVSDGIPVAEDKEGNSCGRDDVTKLGGTPCVGMEEIPDAAGGCTI